MDGRIIFARMGMVDEILVVTASVSICEGFSCQVQMQGKSIAHKYFESLDLNINCTAAFKSLVTFIDTHWICCGNHDEQFRSLAKARKGKFLDISGVFSLV